MGGWFVGANCTIDVRQHLSADRSQTEYIVFSSMPQVGLSESVPSKGFKFFTSLPKYGNSRVREFALERKYDDTNRMYSVGLSEALSSVFR